MEIGIIGLGKMGKHMALRWVEKGVRVVAWNRSPEPAQEIAQHQNGVHAKTIEQLCHELRHPRIVWIMLPHRVVDSYIEKILPFVQKGDIIVDGGNSNFKDSVYRYNTLKEKGIHFVDVGVSGGLAAAKTGYCTMAGGDKQAYDRVAPFLERLCVPNGYGYMGGAGTGHYVKMVHNAIEYGMMQAIGEGFDLLAKGTFAGKIDLSRAAKIWQNGSIIRSFLIDLAAQALERDDDLSTYAAYVDDSGEGRWSAIDAMENSVPFVCNTYALHARYLSRSKDALQFKMLSALRKGFGGHPVKKNN